MTYWTDLQAEYIKNGPSEQLCIKMYDEARRIHEQDGRIGSIVHSVEMENYRLVKGWKDLIADAATITTPGGLRLLIQAHFDKAMNGPKEAPR